jgi:hypothetical protein
MAIQGCSGTPDSQWYHHCSSPHRNRPALSAAAVVLGGAAAAVVLGGAAAAVVSNELQHI